MLFTFVKKEVVEFCPFVEVTSPSGGLVVYKPLFGIHRKLHVAWFRKHFGYEGALAIVVKGERVTKEFDDISQVR